MLLSRQLRSALAAVLVIGAAAAGSQLASDESAVDEPTLAVPTVDAAEPTPPPTATPQPAQDEVDAEAQFAPIATPVADQHPICQVQRLFIFNMNEIEEGTARATTNQVEQIRIERGISCPLPSTSKQNCPFGKEGVDAVSTEIDFNPQQAYVAYAGVNRDTVDSILRDLFLADPEQVQEIDFDPRRYDSRATIWMAVIVPEGFGPFQEINQAWIDEFKGTPAAANSCTSNGQIPAAKADSDSGREDPYRQETPTAESNPDYPGDGS